jgi:hypothetical protein
MTLRKKNAESFTAEWQLNCAVSQQNRNSIDDGIAATTALAMDGSRLKQQALMANGADDPAHVRGGQ